MIGLLVDGIISLNFSEENKVVVNIVSGLLLLSLLKEKSKINLSAGTTIYINFHNTRQF